MMVLAVICFNNWFLGIFFNSRLLFADGSVSEFSATGQPHSVIFRMLDIVSGILFILATFLIAKRSKIDSIAKQLFIVMTAVLGIANMFDALFPLKCSQSSTAGCLIPVNLSFSHFQLPSHAYSSVLIALAYFLLPLSGWIYARHHSRRLGLKLLSLAALATALISVGAVLVHFVTTRTFSVRATGVTQEIQMVILGLWFIFCCRAILQSTYFAELRSNLPPSSATTEKTHHNAVLGFCRNVIHKF